MTMITLVTGNAHKLADWQRLFPGDIPLTSQDVDLEEIQSLDLGEIIEAKAKAAYAVVQAPIIVEDVSCGLDNLGGLPGPFMKFFEKQLGKEAIFRLADHEGDPVTVRCAVAYYDGTDMVQVQSEVHGQVIPARGEHGFGFDYCFVAEGQTKTYAELTPEEKGKISHRGQAIELLLPKLRQRLSNS